MVVSVAELMNASGVRFGTSGARGLVTAMTDRVCYAYTKAFLQMLMQRNEIHRPMRVAIAGDLRSSTPRIMSAVAKAAFELGFDVINGGFVPSPAIALFGLDQAIPTVMVTGSHIPDDRNGIKFNKSTGEMLKVDEADMLAQTIDIPDIFDHSGSIVSGARTTLPASTTEIARCYVQRWRCAFPPDALQGKRVVVFGHSAVGRELLVEVYEALGAEVKRANWSDNFISVDTEAIRPEDTAVALQLAREYAPFAVVSTDGDSDRPLLSNEKGQWLRGDVIGVLAASWLKADAVVTPVSCNTVVERVARFRAVKRTRIGSPYVIVGMQEAINEGYQRVVGYEANGGFLTATDIIISGGGLLRALPTRDPIIAQISVMLAAMDSHLTISQLLDRLPARFTASDRLESFPSSISRARIGALSAGRSSATDDLFTDLIGEIIQMDTTDGVRMTGASGEIVHLRGSGNAPELRCYVEATTPERAQSLAGQVLSRCARWRE